MTEHPKPANFCYADSISSKQILTNDVILKCNLILDKMCPEESKDIVKYKLNDVEQLQILEVTGTDKPAQLPVIRDRMPA